MGCNNINLSTTCGEPTEAPCVNVEKDFPVFSSLKNNKCTTLDEVVDDVYDLLDGIKKDIDLSTLDKKCLTLTVPYKALNVEQAQTDKICELETEVNKLKSCDLLNLDITSCGFDLTCLEGNDPCDTPVTIVTLKDLLQTLINKNCP